MQKTESILQFFQNCHTLVCITFILVLLHKMRFIHEKRIASRYRGVRLLELNGHSRFGLVAIRIRDLKGHLLGVDALNSVISKVTCSESTPSMSGLASKM